MGLSNTDGLPYCSRFSTALSAAQFVGSPSLMGGKKPARIGRNSHTLMPTAATTTAATRNRGLMRILGSV